MYVGFVCLTCFLVIPFGEGGPLHFQRWSGSTICLIFGAGCARTFIVSVANLEGHTCFKIAVSELGG